MQRDSVMQLRQLFVESEQLILIYFVWSRQVKR